MTEYAIEGVRFFFVTSNELGKILSRTTRALRIWEQKGILPKPSVTMPMKTGLGEFSRKLYTEDQAKLLVQWMDMFRIGKSTPFRQSWIDWLHKEWASLEKKFRLKIQQGDSNEKVKELVPGKIPGTVQGT